MIAPSMGSNGNARPCRGGKTKKQADGVSKWEGHGGEGKEPNVSQISCQGGAWRVVRGGLQECRVKQEARQAAAAAVLEVLLGSGRVAQEDLFIPPKSARGSSPMQL